MNVLVFLKQVPDSAVRVAARSDGSGIVTDGLIWSISPNDEFAIEMALGCKDADPATTVKVVSIGPDRTRDALRHAIAMGCDGAELIVEDRPLGGHAIARALAAVTAGEKPDLVLCGRQASDDDQGFVGPAIAEALGWPHVTMVTEIKQTDDGIELTREVDGGHEVWAATFPVAGVVHKSAVEPRYPSLPSILRAKRAPLPERTLESLGVDLGSPAVELVSMSPPPPRGNGRIISDGDAAAKAAELTRILHDEENVL
jgi:electron transfer flavoprotein beta subunit